MELMSERMQLVISPELIEDLDNWRRKQPDIPNRSEALRRLIRKGIDGGKEKAAE
jgi:metal-responsive CopG/Arc/MetJ family transcriptional regulator|tara:strand:+ start:378 stop:542 length:165 start_codon:yes stop_codon:yes gene_type:complete